MKYSPESSLLTASCTMFKEQMWKHFADTSTVNGNLCVL